MLLPVRAMIIMVAGLSTGSDTRAVCDNATWVANGNFYTFWHDTGAACMNVGNTREYSVEWNLGKQGNLVAGEGWKEGLPDRVVHYKLKWFEPGTNGYLSLYGWSTDPLIEYYVVETWGGFTPPGSTATFLGTLTSDGATYRVYRAQRSDQPSIVGNASFYQYWSVRMVRNVVGTNNRITFGNHVSGWNRLGLRLGALNYQVMATEGYGSTGRSDVIVAK